MGCWLTACAPDSSQTSAPQSLRPTGIGASSTAGTVASTSAAPVIPIAGSMSRAASMPGTMRTMPTMPMLGSAGTAATTPAAGAAGGRAPWSNGAFPTGMFPGGANPMGMAPAGAAGTGPAATPASAGSGGVVTAAPSAMGDRATPEGVCARWKADRADIGEGMWSGDATTCEVGDMDPMARAAALRVLNLYRWLADLPEITSDPTKDKQAQACALLMRANNSLSHMPPPDWMCYMAEGA